jgi:hypothetical protein
MKRGVKFLSLLLVLCSLVATVALAEETLTNNSILDLHKLGLGEAVIVEKIKLTTCDFDTSTAALKGLKEAGVPDGVLAAMLRASAPKAAGTMAPVTGGDPNDPASPHESGIYYFSEQNGAKKMSSIDASVFSQTKSGIAVFAAYGQQSKTRGLLQGAHARIQLSERRPVFYFYFDRTTASLSGGSTEKTSPEEFTLAAMEVNEKKAERSVIVGNWGLYAGARSGVDKKVSRPILSEKVGLGVFKVTPDNGLADGEYCFLYAGAAPPVGYGFAGGSGPMKAFCFGVQSNEPPPPKVK